MSTSEVSGCSPAIRYCDLQPSEVGILAETSSGRKVSRPQVTFFVKMVSLSVKNRIQVTP